MLCFVFLLLTFAVFIFGLSFATIQRTSITYRDAIERYHYYYSAANQKKIAFTFDDGPNGHITEELMDTLESANAPATFFFIGKRALVRPDLVKEAVNRGFDVEDHSFTHAEDIHSSYSRMAFELNSTSFLLSQITGTQTNIYRPPFLLGIGVDPTINPYIPLSEDMEWALQLGYLPVGSDIDSKDWLAQSPTEVLESLKRGLTASPNGHIVLFHDDTNTAKAMGSIVTHLREDGYKIVPLSELITPPTGAALALVHPLKRGDTDGATDGEVSKLQWFLYTQKFLDPYALSGVFDDATYAALVNFQSKNGLIDPTNPNASVVGKLSPQTRDKIAAAALAAVVPAAAPSQSAFQKGFKPVHDFFITAYINLFPAVRGFFMVAVFTTLILVGIRTGMLLGLLLYRALSGKKDPEKADQDGGPGVSILVPAYNEEENIAATIESLVRTHYKNREIIVIDDGSKDKTGQEVQSVIAAHPDEKIRLITTANGGKASALNIGVEGASHEIVVVLDADAVLDPDAISYFVSHMSDPTVGAVAGKVRTTNASNMLDIFQTLEYAIGQNIDKSAFSMINAIGVVPGPAGAWRKSFIVEAGGFHTDTLVEDQEMTLSMLHLGYKVIYDARAIAYTETPHSIKNFLKQRFRWVYGTMQCFWKHKGIIKEKPLSSMSLVVMPNIFVYNILLPLTYPFADSALLFGLIFGEWHSLIMPFLIFTGIDLLYAIWGLRGEPNKWKLMAAVPLQRIVYRQLLYYTVYKGLVRAIEGTGTTWNKFAKTGETRRFYLSAMGGLQAALEGVKTPLPIEPTTASEFKELAGEEVMSLSVMAEEKNPYVQSPPFGPTLSR